MCLETETGLVRSYSTQEQPSGQELHWLEVAVVGKKASARLIAGQCQPDLQGSERPIETCLFFYLYNGGSQY